MQPVLRLTQRNNGLLGVWIAASVHKYSNKSVSPVPFYKSFIQYHCFSVCIQWIGHKLYSADKLCLHNMYVKVAVHLLTDRLISFNFSASSVLLLAPSSDGSQREDTTGRCYLASLCCVEQYDQP